MRRPRLPIGTRMFLLGRLGLCGESTLRHPHRGFAEAHLVVPGKLDIRLMLCKDHAVSATRFLIRECGGTATIR